MEVGGKKDAPDIADMVVPLIWKMEKSRDKHNKLRPGVVDLVLFDCASNEVKADKILVTHYPHFPCISVVHVAEHVVSPFLRMSIQMWVHQCYCVALWMLQSHNHNYYHQYLQCDLFRILSNFGNRLRNVFGACRHLPHAMFHKDSKAHKHGISVRFIKSMVDMELWSFVFNTLRENN